MIGHAGLVAVTAACGFHGSGTGDDVAGDAASPDAAIPSATYFVADALGDHVYRYAIDRDHVTPTAPLAIALDNATSPLLVGGQLLVGQKDLSAIVRLATPSATPTPSGTITGNGLSSNFGKMIVVDDEVWVVNAGGTDIDRLAVGATTATMVGSLPVMNGRGLVFDPITRDLFVSQCCNTDTILHFTLDAARAPTSRPSITGDGIHNPHGLLITAWGELFASANTNQVLRFTFDGAGQPTRVGVIDANALSTPIDLAMAPWGELFVTNQGNGAVSRFTFDPTTHAAIEHGFFTVPAAATGLAWAALVPD
ncbi:MAG: hypothetical protein NT062_00715 [Proteobacteria bacterium]|nr:hypothetical protein [Pseudomonadota bacterium]